MKALSLQGRHGTASYKALPCPALWLGVGAS